ncbi:hypothetical protein PEX2_088030 [Penicillium expansum]|uniref:Uncharacterized protein n=1 Tax=Penicillium expansum TaxID=27334 RepID=A0A0A2K0L7_PENEN|nr:hypothetical protein PEX2_088030 [Penicillium expansum]KGO35945.1 hypothetical protein PEXP_037330 [Penicillium expansum]KGO60621.1 hypothetical protein PEX2_088030 [Penicillium expansum]
MDLKCETTQSINSSYSEGEHYKNETVTCHLAPPQGKSTQFDVNFYTLWEDSSPNPVGLDYTTSGISWHVFSAYGRSLQYRRQTGDEPFTWPSDPLMVLGYAEIGYNEDYLDSDLSGGIRVDKVTECSLELCHLEYEVSFGNGTPHINTSVLDYGQLFWRNSSEARSKQMLCWKPTSGPPPPDIIIENVTISNDSFVRLSPVEGVFCGIEDNIILDENVFTGSTIHVHGRLRSEHGYGQDYDVMREDSDRNVLRIGSVGLDVIMSNVAGHMNKEGLARNGSDVNGIAYVTEVFVEVQWLWLILPIILVVSGTIFIVIVIIENRKNGTNLWKSSVLAFCYHGLHDVDKDDSMAASVMERKAEELIVRLQESEDHGGLVLREKKNLLEVHE